MERNDITDRPFRIKLWEHSPSTEVICSFGSYMHNGTLALELMSKPEDPMMEEIFGGGQQFFERYGTVTVNLDISHILPPKMVIDDETCITPLDMNYTIKRPFKISHSNSVRIFKVN